MTATLAVAVERWPIAGRFTIARGSKTEAVVVVATVARDGRAGCGECVPYARYGETVEGVADAIRAQASAIEAGIGRDELQTLLPGGAARNALDCALWDLEAKHAGRRAWELAGIAALAPLTTAYTLSLGAPEEMAAAARAASSRPLLKVKLGGGDDPARIRAVRDGAPGARLIVDANEAWREDVLEANLAACAAAGVSLVEQPMPADADGLLARIARPVPVCADESVHTRAGLADLAARYDAVNVKLDKTGGLTEALALAADARALGMEVMLGCMLGTSLGMAPAMIAAQGAAVVDLDGPLLLARDRVPGITFHGSVMQPPPPELWG